MAALSPRAQTRLRIAGHSLAFVLGLSTVFVALGFGAGFISNFLFDFGDLLQTVAGLVLIVMGLAMLRVLPIPWMQRDLRFHLASKPPGYAGSALVGVAFAAGWTPCVGPILAGILALAGSSGSAGEGALLLGVYALGFALPFLLFAQLLPLWRQLRRHGRLLERLGGVLLILVGLILVFGWVSRFAPYLAGLGSLESVLSRGAEPSLALAFTAGALSFLSPCVLPILPSFLAYLLGKNAAALAALPIAGEGVGLR
jgi:cytochrome c-type biogenesis protein